MNAVMMQGNFTQLQQYQQQENLLQIDSEDMAQQCQHQHMINTHQGGRQNMIYHHQHEYSHQSNLQGCGGRNGAILSPSGSPVCQLKRLHPGATNTATELLRCKRRIDFMAQLGYSSSGHSSRQVNSVARRNERERNRVRLVNHGFALLRQHVPTLAGKAKKLSKVDTLRAAVEYIQQLKDVLEENNGEETEIEGNHSLSPSTSPSSSSSSSGGHSPGGYSSDSSAVSGQGQFQQLEELESQDGDLADFSSWFC